MGGLEWRSDGDEIRVLCLDDDEDVLRLAERQLDGAQQSLQVQTARTVAEARAAFDGTVDCVVADYRLPDGTGLELLETVREDHPDLPFFLVTARGSEAVAGRAASADVTGYLQKADTEASFAQLADRIVETVSERRAALAEARADRRVRRVHERITDAVVALDTDWRYTYCNSHAEALLERSAAELLGERVWDAFPEIADTAFEETLRSAVATTESTRTEAYFPPLDRWFEVRVFPDEDGLSIYFRDVTARKSRERELERKNERLQEFAGVVSHDLRNPMAVATASVDLARETDEPEHLDRAATALDRMEALVDDLLRLAERGEVVSDPEPVDLRAIVEQVTDDLLLDGVTATVACPADATVLADRSRLLELLENLLRNAVEHGSTSNRNAARSDDAVEHGSTSPRSSSTHEDAVEHGSTDSPSSDRPDAGADDASTPPRAFVRGGSDGPTVEVEYADGTIAVSDDGPGVPPSEREDVFDPGYTTAEDGTGFGLSIVRTVAEAHGWTVSATESEWGGARFEVAGLEEP